MSFELKKNNFLSKIWHCVVVFVVIYGVVPAIFLAINPILGISETIPPYNVLLPMTMATLLSCFIFWKLNGTLKPLMSVGKHCSVKTFCLYVIVFLIFSASSVLMSAKDNDIVVSDVTSSYYLALIVFFIVVAIGEEVLFRGLFLNRLIVRYKPWIVIVGISFFFAIGHVDNFYHFLSSFISSLFFSVAYYKTRSIVLCIIMHFSGDLFMQVIYGTLGGGHYLLGGGLLFLSFLGILWLSRLKGVEIHIPDHKDKIANLP